MKGQNSCCILGFFNDVDFLNDDLLSDQDKWRRIIGCMVMMNWKERVCADCYDIVPEFAFGTREKKNYGGGITARDSQHEEERNAEEILQNAGCVLVLISVISLG
jgi:hypothetical protein